MQPLEEIIEIEIDRVAVLESLGEIRLPSNSIIHIQPLSRLPRVGAVHAEIPLVFVALVLAGLIEHSDAADEEIRHTKTRN